LITEITEAFIAGNHVASRDTYDNIDPATGCSLGAVARTTAEDVDHAVTSAAQAQRQWRKSSPEERSRLLVETARLIRADRDNLALLESSDTGKPLTQAYGDADTCARYFEFLWSRH
jgi:aldehyde dehydrogenase (NAD+)